jgi:hypothetical protein
VQRILPARYDPPQVRSGEGFHPVGHRAGDAAGRSGSSGRS